MGVLFGAVLGNTIKCPGCCRTVDVTAPAGMKHEVIHGRDRDGARFVEIQIARTTIHRCLECRDGVWR